MQPDSILLDEFPVVVLCLVSHNVFNVVLPVLLELLVFVVIVPERIFLFFHDNVLLRRIIVLKVFQVENSLVQPFIKLAHLRAFLNKQVRVLAPELLEHIQLIEVVAVLEADVLQDWHDYILDDLSLLEAFVVQFE